MTAPGEVKDKIVESAACDCGTGVLDTCFTGSLQVIERTGTHNVRLCCAEVVSARRVIAHGHLD
jgi:hypothetical protein